MRSKVRLAVPLIVLLIPLLHAAAARAAEDAAPPRERAAPAERAPLRTAGTIVLDEVLAARSSGLPVTVGWLSYRSETTRADGASATSTTQLRFAPSLDVLVVSGLSLGGQAYVDQLVIEGAGSRMTTSSREIAPRVGYAFALGEAITFWPRAYAAYGWSDTAVEATGAGLGTLGGGASVGALGGSPAGAHWRVGADASVLLSLGRYVALGAGPTLSYARGRVDLGPSAPASPHAVTTSFDVGIAASLRLVL